MLYSRTRGVPGAGIYTILAWPIWYGVCHTKGRSRGGRLLPNSREIVLQQYSVGNADGPGEGKDD